MRQVGRSVVLREAVLGGVFAGMMYASFQALAGAWARRPPGNPYSLLVEPGANSPAALALALVLFCFLSAAYGALYGLIVDRIPRGRRTRYPVQLALGAAFALPLAWIDHGLIGRLILPLLVRGELVDSSGYLLHAISFGAPLGWWLCLRLRDRELPGVHTARHRVQNATGQDERVRLRLDIQDQFGPERVPARPVGSPAPALEPEPVHAAAVARLGLP